MKKNNAVMKYWILIFAVGFVLKGQAQNTDEFQVSGTLKGLDVPYMFIDYTHDITGDRVWDTLFVENESFSYSAKAKNTKRIAIWPLLARTTKEQTVGKQTRIEFLVRPGDAIVFKGKVTEDFEAVSTGTDLCDDINSFNKSAEPLNAKSSEIMKRAFAHKPGTDEFKVIYDSTSIVEEELNKLKRDFIRNNPKSEVSAWYLSEMVMRSSIEDEAALELFNNLDEQLGSCLFYIQVNTRLKGSEATKPGSIVPNVVTNRTLNGTEFNLASTRGKYVLIDFWGIWCGPCVAEMPKVKEYKEKYKDQLVIIGINSGDTNNRIKDFVESKGYDWLQLSSKKGESEDNLVSRFNVTGFPTKFIVDKEGTILHRYVGGSEEAFVKLDELLKK